MKKTFYSIIFLFFFIIYFSSAQSWSELGGLNGLAAVNDIYSVCSDSSGNIYAAGEFTNSSGNRYVAKWNGNSWSELGGLNGLAPNTSIYSVCNDVAGNIYAAGFFTNSSGYRYVAKYDISTGINQLTVYGLQFTISPNPVKDELLINGYSFTGKEKTEITIADVNGKRVYHSFAAPYFPLPARINVRNFSNGIYFIEVTDGKEKVVKKFLKE